MQKIARYVALSGLKGGMERVCDLRCELLLAMLSHTR